MHQDQNICTHQDKGLADKKENLIENENLSLEKVVNF